MSLMLPGLVNFSDVDSLFREPYPVPGETVIKYNSIKATASFARAIEFADDAKAKLLDIAITLQSQMGDDFAPQRMYLMIPVIKAVAFITGHKKVVTDDLWIMDCIWFRPSRRDEFNGIVESIVSNFFGLAEQFRNQLAKIRTRFTNAKGAVAANEQPNYWDNTIPANWTLDDVVVHCMTETTQIEAELIALTDGKNPVNKAQAPLFAALDEAKNMKKQFAALKGVKV